jgi:hypothetical protein
VTLQLAVDEQAVRRAIDIAVFDVNPRCVHQTMEMRHRRGLFGGGHIDARE